MKSYFRIKKAALEACIVSKDNIKDYLEWHKIAITICSAMIGGMSLKFGGSNTPLPFKLSVGLFIVSMVLLFWSYICVAESKSNLKPSSQYLRKLPNSFSSNSPISLESTYTLTNSTKRIFGLAWFVFMCAFTAMAVGIIIPPSSDLYVTLFMH